MEINREYNDEIMWLNIKGAFNIYEASKLREELNGCFDSSGGVILNLNEVEDCDTAIVQVLCAARKTAETINKGFTIAEASDSLINAVNRVGLTMEFFEYDPEG